MELAFALVVTAAVLSCLGWVFKCFCHMMQRLGGTNIRVYERQGDGTITYPGSREHLPRRPECACYYDGNGGPYGRPHWVNGRTCEKYYLTHDEWPAWCQGPAS